MSTRKSLALEFSAPPGPAPSFARPAGPAAGTAALAVAVASLRALKERGTLSPGEIDDVLADARWRLRDPAAQMLLEQVRSDLERTDDGP